MRPILLLLALLLTMPLAACAEPAPPGTPQPLLPTRTLLLQGPAGEQVPVVAELAATEPTRQRGLMFRTELPPGTGMLFLFPSAQPLAFWMKNTPLPLDLLFFHNRQLVHLHEGAVPFDETPIPSPYPADSVLEVPAGWAAAQGLTVTTPPWAWTWAE